jgi:hypothetical protein
MRSFEFKVDLPEDVFDGEFRQAEFAARMRELVILELLRAKRLHEHEALAMLGIERRELLERMEAAGIAPTERVFHSLKDELDGAIASANERRTRDRKQGT